MAELTFVGAAGTVTGSKHLLSTGGKHVLIDCGLFQGGRALEALNGAPLPVAAADVEAIVVTHGHIDHVGYLPKIVHDGFAGPIYCTPPTAAIIEIVLNDAEHLQAHLERRGMRHDPAHAVPPLYDANDVAATLRLREPVALETEFTVARMTLRYKNAGHIVGSAFIEAEVEGKCAVFSGDLGRYGRPLLYDPAPLGAADVIVCETTYGDRVHPPDSLGSLRDVLLAGIRRGGPIVIPAFAVERTQDILLAIGLLQTSEPAIAQTPVHVDSPMADKVDAVFAQFPDSHKPFPDGAAPFGCRNVNVAGAADDSKILDRTDGPAIVISSGGMATGGRVLNHLHRRIPDPTATIAFVGYQVPGTLGAALSGGARTVRIFGDVLPVRAEVRTLSGFSAHADESELLRWVRTTGGKPHVYAVHGDPPAATAFAAAVTQQLGFEATVAARGTTVTL
ncbi:MAG: MBL fold metallo-hydrolase RNA specificity domain-containing protein [Candidatus Velthaea sp.]